VQFYQLVTFVVADLTAEGLFLPKIQAYASSSELVIQMR